MSQCCVLRWMSHSRVANVPLLQKALLVTLAVSSEGTTKTRGRMWKVTGAPGVPKRCRNVKTISAVRFTHSTLLFSANKQTERVSQGFLSVCSFQSMKRRMRTTTAAIPQRVGQTLILQRLMRKRPGLRTSLMRKEEMFLLQPRLSRLSNQLPPLTQPPRPAARPVRPPRPPLPPQPPRCGVLKSPQHRPRLNQQRGPRKSTRPSSRRRRRKTRKSKRRK